MAIRESWVPGVYLREWRPVYRIAGDPKPFRQFSTRGAAEKAEAELAAAKPGRES